MPVSTKLVDAELARRSSLASIDLLSSSFPEQRAFIEDPCRLKAALCTRRAAKSYSAGLYLFKEALENPGVSCLYLALTRESAKRIMVKDVLGPINKKWKLGAKFNKTELSYTLPNGSVIYLLGADSDEKEKDKLFGQKYKLVVIDEAASFTTNLEDLVYSVLKPAVADYRGTICLISMPTNITKSFYHRVSEGQEGGWAVHKWNTHQNPYMAVQWQEELDEIAANRPLYMGTPRFKQQYLGLWVIDKDALVYKFDGVKNAFKELPMTRRGEWTYRIGCDLGYEDATAFVVGAYHEHDKKLYIVHVHKEPHMDITDVATYLKGLIVKHGANPKVIVDGANKQAVEEMRNRHQLNLEAADKRGKEDFIELMNADLIMEQIKLGPGAQVLADEWSNLVWKEKNGEIVKPKEENESCENHAADAALYLWRMCTNFHNEREHKPVKPGSKEYYEQEVKAISDHYERISESFDNPEPSDEDYI